ncbi:MAG: (2Fe-2S)-binding protein [Deltaproteobacteria bacterium]|nr:(2Fe-2S)-binding protein [Deltaproteobacteria bacterium]
MQKTITVDITLNDQAITIEIPTGISALTLIRDNLKLKGTKEGCGIGECGACTIQVDGKAVDSCLMFAAQLDGRNVLTVEGLETPAGLHPIQEAFLENHGVQCGFCTPGLLMSTNALLMKNPHPDLPEIRRAIAGNLCRCTGYQQIVTSIEKVGEKQGRRS